LDLHGATHGTDLQHGTVAEIPMGELMEISGRNVLVTGAARGIGAATAAMLAERGAARVVIADIDAAALEETASVAAFGPMPADPAYSASKAGIVNFTESCKPLHDAFG